MCFNTSHVTVKLIAYNRNGEYCNSFNTSHVTVKYFMLGEEPTISCASIHLMLLLNTFTVYNPQCLNRLQYISCYC